MGQKISPRQRIYLDGLPEDGTERITGAGAPMSTIRALQRVGLVRVRYISDGSRWAVARASPKPERVHSGPK